MSEFQGKNFEFDIGEIVEKFTGDYQISGMVVGYTVTSRGLCRYTVEIFPGLLHIYNGSQLRRVK